MLPLSLVRTSPAALPRISSRRAYHSLRPANTSSGAIAERRALVVWLAIIVGLVVSIGLGRVWLQHQVNSLGYRLSATQKIIDRLEQERKDLTVQVATLHRSTWIEQEARTRLGMIRPEKGQEAVLP